MKIYINRFAGTVVAVDLLLERSGRFIHLYRRRKNVRIEKFIELPPIDDKTKK